ncbi:hypothetical protein GCM10009670_24770 [Citricoccus alkalitolerans]
MCASVPQRVTDAMRMTAIPGDGIGAAMLRYSMARRLVVTAAVAMVAGVVEVM